MKTSILRDHRDSAPPRPTFTIACWLLALIAFAQLISVGTALTVKQSNTSHPANHPKLVTTSETRKTATTQQAIAPRSLDEILARYGNNPEGSSPAPSIATPHAPVSIRVPTTVTLPPSTPFAPPIADPQVEKLVQEARSLHMDGDMMRAMLKLDEAARIDPAEPAVIYQKAVLFEDMNLYIKAADHYQRIQQMGSKAGVYFGKAAKKLTEGMDTRWARRSVIALGPIKTRKTGSPEGVKHADVSITILARPDQPVNPADVHVQIHFYDKINGGEVKQAVSSAEITSNWADTELNWTNAGNSETLLVSYTIPEADLADEHLLGRREFYGYVVELLYKGEIIDQQAHPRRLHSVHGSKMNLLPEPPPLSWPTDDNGSLLPDKAHGYGNTPSAPPLPSR